MKEHAKVCYTDEHSLSDARFHINEYETELSQVKGFMDPVISKGKDMAGGDVGILFMKIDKMIRSSKIFDKNIGQLIKDGRFRE